jgi:hypothetical protein
MISGAGGAPRSISSVILCITMKRICLLRCGWGASAPFDHASNGRWRDRHLPESFWKPETTGLIPTTYLALRPMSTSAKQPNK